MRKLLILVLVCLTTSYVHAQVPVQITVPNKANAEPNPNSPDAVCSAGTFTVGQHIGQSNDVSLDTIFLCFGDSLLIDHNGNEMYMDPNPATPPGIAYAFYNCPPTATGDDMAVLADPCLWPGSFGTGFWPTLGPPSGDHWFFNTGGILNSALFCNMNPCLITFAPITITDYTNRELESGCVDVNINEAFSVVYLKAIEADAIVTNFNGDDCKGKFRLRHGYPGWDLNGTYTVTITLDSDPSVKALIYTPPAQIRHTTNVIFSVPQAGTYTVTVEDGKSCGLTFQINMGGCTPSDNVGISMPNIIAQPGTQVCIPVTVENFDSITGSSFSISWDPTILSYVGVQNPHPEIEPFSQAGNLNENETILGNLGFTYSDFLDPNGTSIPDSAILWEVCFNVIAPIGSCTPLDFGSFPTIVTMDEATGLEPAISATSGELCVDLIPLVIEFYVSAPNCNNTASIGAIISGGSAPYEVSWETCTGGSQSFVVSNVADTILTAALPEGCWIVCVTDQNGFGSQVCNTLDISIPSLGATLTVVQSPSCNNSTDGILRADVTVDGVLIPNPGPNFTYEWNTVPPQDMQTISNVPANGYSVTVTDVSTGCTQVAAGALSQPPALGLNLQITPASCAGIADGAINAIASGGTPGPAGSDYIFEWEYSAGNNPPNPTPDDSFLGNPCVLTGKQGGYYYITVTDANGCTYVHPVDIEIPNAREFKVDTIGMLDPTCFGLSNGSILVEANANPAFTAPTYLFFWNPIPPTPAGPYPQNDVVNMSTLSGLPAGGYDMIVLEVNTGCTADATFTLGQPQPLNLVSTELSPSCQNQNDGSITITAGGGTGAISYLWSSVPATTLPPIPNQTGLGPGVYTVRISDANGCLDSLSIPLSLPAPPAITGIDSTSVVCGTDGCLRVISPTAVSFNWTTLAGAPVGTTQQVCGLVGGTYIVTVRNAQNCVNSDTITLGAITPVFVADTLLTLPTCNGGSDGSIALDVQGGNPGYLYNWSSGQNTPVIFAIPAGTYTVTVTDSKGCTLTQTYVLPNPPGIVLQYNNITPATCPGACDGGVELVTYYNTVPPALANFDFLWEDGGTDSVRTNLCAGYNTITVRDPISGCFRIDSVLIGAPPAFTATFVNDSVSCFGDNNGRTSVTVTGGNGQPYTYLWSTGATFPNVTNLVAGPITLTVTDNAGCTQVFTTTILQPEQILITTPVGGLLSPNCFGGSDGSLEITVSNGTPGYTYNWAGSTGVSSTENPITNLAAGTYTVTVTDNNGCTEVQFFNLTNPPSVIGSYLPWDPILCNGEETTLFIDTILGGAGAPYQYSLDFGVYLDPGFPVPLSGGEHYITYIDRAGCEQTDTIFVIEPAPIVVTFNPDMVEIELGDSLQLIPLITGSTVADFEWTPANLLSNPDTLEPFTTTYQSQLYTLVVFDANGCSATGSIQVNIDPNRNVYIPNVFKAVNNGSGLNDHFNPNVGRGVDIINYMRVFDRWGSLMYERNTFYPNNNDFAEGWDGKHKGQYVSPGVYVYVIEVKFLDGRVLLYRGDVTVLR